MFETLSDRFDGIFSRLKGKGKLSEADVDEVLREIRVALLEADVNLVVVKAFVSRVRERAVGEELSRALNPAQQVIKIVQDELVAILGGETFTLSYASKPPTVVLMAGLQGSGKTTTTAKLARWFKAQGRNPLMVGADLQRPAAVEQLRTLGAQIDVPVFSEPTDPVAVAAAGREHAQRTGRDVLLVDTAGRLAIDAELMDEVRRISEVVEPNYTLLVVDAMTGQDAVATAESFHETLGLDGVILTKLDGDARGGAALSVREVVGKPIAFASTGEKLGDFDVFHPDRLAGRILGMGDVLSLIEKAEQVYEAEEAEAAAARLMEGRFTLEDFLDQLQQIKKMGPLSGLVGMLPGMPKELRNADIDDSQITRVEAMIRSMTPSERAEPDLIDASRRSRIAEGSGTSPQDISTLVKQFSEMQRMMKRMGGMGSKKMTSKSRKGRKRKGRGGGRVTAKGGATMPMPDLAAELEAGLESLGGPGAKGLRSGKGAGGGKAGDDGLTLPGLP
jgi:signal recognition particle subunit SRP54